MNRQSGDQHWTRLHPSKVARGTSHPCSKLTPDQLEELRELAKQWGPSDLARYFGISRVTVWRYLNLR